MHGYVLLLQHKMCNTLSFLDASAELCQSECLFNKQFSNFYYFLIFEKKFKGILKVKNKLKQNGNKQLIGLNNLVVVTDEDVNG